ncbi:MAG TPA: hypothetical protein VK578_00920 [Edaphobacter sp.]|nr:hypothetical protein [Edaphobacter sp.]
MVLKSFFAVVVFAANVASSQTSAHITAQSLPLGTTIPIIFTKSIDANHVHAGDPIAAKTTQLVILADGHVLPVGSQVVGHVIAGTPFAFDPTPYAKQKQSSLEIQFDAIVDHGDKLPLSVYVRAIADPLSSWDATKPKSTDFDSLSTTTQIGGDLVTPSQSEVRSQEDDVVGYKRREGVFAHLIAAKGSSPDGCDASDTEQSMGIFSASACGLYGFPDTTFVRSGRSGTASTILLESRRRPMKIYSKSNALLEVTDGDIRVAAR